MADEVVGCEAGASDVVGVVVVVVVRRPVVVVSRGSHLLSPRPASSEARSRIEKSIGAVGRRDVSAVQWAGRCQCEVWWLWLPVWFNHVEASSSFANEARDIHVIVKAQPPGMDSVSILVVDHQANTPYSTLSYTTTQYNTIQCYITLDLDHDITCSILLLKK